MKKISIFGAGISGAVIARKYAEKGYLVDIYELSNFIGGNCYDYYDTNKVLIHKFGPHIFHTSNEEVYKFISKYTKLNGFINKVQANVDGKLINLPINFNSFKQLDPIDYQNIIKTLTNLYPNDKTITLEQLSEVKDKKIHTLYVWIFNNIYANYTNKMWGTPIDKIDPAIINRVKISLSTNDSYFPLDKYQGLPIGGYTKFIRKILTHKNIKIHLNCSKNLLKVKNNSLYINNKITNDLVFYSGSIDELFNFKYGHLQYRSLNIVFEQKNVTKFQDTAVVNYPSHPSMTRITEYKNMTLQKVNGHTTISKEYPGQYSIKSKKFNKPYYPIQDKHNQDMYKKYFGLAKSIPNLHLIGRLGNYKYYDMDDAIAEALDLCK